MARPGSRWARLGGFWEFGGASGELRGRFLELLGSHLLPKRGAGRPPERSMARPGGRWALLGGFWALGGAPGELRGRFLELLGAHFDALGTTLGDLGGDFLAS